MFDFFFCSDFTFSSLSRIRSAEVERPRRFFFLCRVSGLRPVLPLFRVSCLGAERCSYNLTIWHIWSIVAPGMISLTLSGVPFVIAESVHNCFLEIFLSKMSAICVGQVYVALFGVSSFRDFLTGDLDLLRDSRRRLALLGDAFLATSV